ncbi:MAG TPA: four helix bundle protein [Gemmatimonadaceae bacterium]|nr:four helix bundle protein [Gemmatimonadaceae bacterium]
MPNAEARRSAIRTYRDLRVWQHARELFVALTRLIRQLPFSERLVFESQTRRAARGVAASIAEGFRRRDLGDYVRSLSYAGGSLGEVESDLNLLSSINDVDPGLLKQCDDLCIQVGRELTALETRLRRLRRDGKRTHDD